MVDLSKTGIDGLDAILAGGIAKTSVVLLSGNPGTGKTILGLQYIYNGVSKYDEPGIYLTFEENESDIRLAAESVGFDSWAEYVDDGRIKVYDKRVLLQESDFSSTIDRLLDDFEEMNVERLVVDSFSMFELFFADEREKRTYLLKFVDILKQNGLTTLLVNEQGGMFPETEINLENFLTDGNIYLIQMPTQSGVNRYVWVAKMRKQHIDTDIFPLEIGNGGITIHQNASEFSMLGPGSSFSF